MLSMLVAERDLAHERINTELWVIDRYDVPYSTLCMDLFDKQEEE